MRQFVAASIQVGPEWRAGGGGGFKNMCFKKAGGSAAFVQLPGRRAVTTCDRLKA